LACASAVNGAGLITGFQLANTLATQRNKSCMVISSVIVNAIRNHAPGQSLTPQPKAKKQQTLKKATIYPPPLPSFAATLAITGAARMLCMVVSNQTNSKTIPTTRSSDNTGRRSLRRRISQMPKMNKATGRCKFPSQGPGLEKHEIGC